MPYLRGTRLPLLSGGLAAPAPAATVVVRCTFNDANDTNLNSYSWADPDDIRPGANQWDNWTSTWSCQSQYGQAAAGDGVLTRLVCGYADGTLSADINLITTSSTRPRGLLYRLTDISNFWLVGFLRSDNTFGIFQKASGSWAARDTVAFTYTAGQDYAVQVVLNGNSMIATLDGANQVSYSSATGVALTTHGAHARYAGDKMDNFQMTL